MAVALVQDPVKTVINAGGATITTNPISLTVGNLLVLVALEFGNFGSALPAPTSAKFENTTVMTAEKTFEANTSGTFRMRISYYSLPNIPLGGNRTVTVAHSGNLPDNILYFLLEISGATTTAASDSAGAGANGLITPADSGTATSTKSNDFWIAATTSLAGNPAHFTHGTGWTMPATGSSETNSAANLCGAVEYAANPGVTSLNGQFIVDAGDWVCVTMAYLASAAGPSTADIYNYPSQ